MASGLPRGSMPQDCVFYTKEWTRTLYGVFIRAITEQTVNHHLSIHRAPNRNAAMYVMTRVNQQLGVVHYPINHSVFYTDEAWSALCRYDALGHAYGRRGEEEFDTLKFIFTAVHDSDIKGESESN